MRSIALLLVSIKRAGTSSKRASAVCADVTPSAHTRWQAVRCALDQGAPGREDLPGPRLRWRRLQDHRLIPEHGPFLLEDPKIRRIRKIVGKRNVVNMRDHARIQRGKHFQEQEGYVAVDAQAARAAGCERQPGRKPRRQRLSAKTIAITMAPRAICTKAIDASSASLSSRSGSLA